MRGSRMKWRKRKEGEKAGLKEIEIKETDDRRERDEENLQKDWQ